MRVITNSTATLLSSYNSPAVSFRLFSAHVNPPLIPTCCEYVPSFSTLYSTALPTHRSWNRSRRLDHPRSQQRTQLLRYQ